MNKKIFILSILSFTFLNCKKDYQPDNISKTDGEYYYSEDANISYFFPNGFTPFISENESEYNDLTSQIKNPKLQKILSTNYIENHILPIAKNFQYLFKEDSINYQNIFVNEIKYFRLNDAGADVLSLVNRREINSINKDSTKHINLYNNYFINKSDYQIIISKGDLIVNNDTIFFENYIVSKFYRTFSIQIESNSSIDFLPYIDKIKFGNKNSI